MTIAQENTPTDFTAEQILELFDWIGRTNGGLEPDGIAIQGEADRIVSTPLEAEEDIPSFGPERDINLWDRIFDTFKPSPEEQRARSAVTLARAERLGVRPGELEISLQESVEFGLDSSIVGLIHSGKGAEIESMEKLEYMTNFQRIASQATTLLSDLPIMIAGGTVGAVGGAGNPLTAFGGAFALPAGLRQVLMDHYEKGDISSFSDFFSRLTAATIETLKGETIGIATGAAGRAVHPLLRYPAEVTAMVGMGAALEGRIPEPKEFLDAAVVITGLHAATGMSRIASAKLKSIYAETGIRPVEVLEDIQRDPSILEDLREPGEEIPRVYKETIEAERVFLQPESPIQEVKPETTKPRPAPELSRADPIQGKPGKETEVLPTKAVAEYRLVEAEDLVPSHRPAHGYSKDPRYPEGVQPRPYHKEKDAQFGVETEAAKLNPGYLVNDNPDAINGPPIITEGGIVLGGNRRAMMMQLVYTRHKKRGEAYKDALREKAGSFGYDSSEVEAMERPVLVRVIRGEIPKANMARMAQEFNQPATRAMEMKSEGVALSRMVGEESSKIVSRALEEHDTIRSYLSSAGSKSLIDSLVKDGVLDKAKLNRYINKKTNLLSEEGKRIVENTLRGMVLEDFDLMDALPPSTLGKFDKALPSLVRIKARGDEWDVTRDLIEAAEEFVQFKASKTVNLDAYRAQRDIFKTPPSDKAQILTELLSTLGPKKFADAFSEYTKMMDLDVKGQATFGFAKPPTQMDAFREVFVSKTSLGVVAERLGEKTRKELDRVGQRGAVGIDIDAEPKPEGKYRFDDPKREAEWKEDTGTKKDPLRQRIFDSLVNFKNLVTREYEHLPKDAAHARLRLALLKLSKSKGISSDKTIRDIQSILVRLKGDDYNIFRRRVVLNDYLETMEGQLEAGEKVHLPRGWTEAEVRHEHARITKATEGNTRVQEALADRDAVWEALKADYLQAMKDIGFDVKDRFKRKAYFRHQVLEYVNMKGLFGTGKQLKTPRGRSFLKRRTGNEAPINVDYVQTEHEVMAQMLFDIETARTIKTVDVEFNIQDSLKMHAARANNQEIMKHFEELADLMTPKFADPEAPEITAEGLFRQTLNKSQAIGFGELGRMASEGELPLGPKYEWATLVDELAESWRTRAADIEEGVLLAPAEFSKESGKQLFKYLSWILKEHGGESPSGPAAAIFKGIRAKREYIKEHLGDKYVTWRELIPDDHATWQPDPGNVFYMADSIPAKMAEMLASGKLEEIGLKKEDIQKVLAVGGKRKEFVLPNNVIETLNNMFTERSDNWFLANHRSMLKYWKMYQLLQPRRLLKYNIRNLTGDADAVFAGNPGSFLKSKQAMQDLWTVFFQDKPMSKDLKDFFERGGFQTTLQAQEIGDLNDLSMFSRALLETKTTRFQDIPIKTWRKYWSSVRLATDYRESILRYASYLDYLEQMRADPKGRPKNFGASIPEEVMALPTIKDRAYWMSNDLLGAYDRVGKIGQDLRANLYPFWSWKEVNFRRYTQLFRNAASERKIARLVGRQFGTKSPVVAMAIGRMMVRATAFWSALQVYNNTVWREEEANLPEHIRMTPHIVLGKDEETGETNYFNRIGALGDFLEWFGIDAAPHFISEWMQGKKTPVDIAWEMAKSAPNIVVQGGEPFLRLGFELLTRQSLFPYIFEPRVVKDELLHIARSYGLENEYIALADLPSRGYGDSLENFFYYKSDPFEAAYNDTISHKHKWMKKQGKYGDGFWITPKGLSLYWARLALRYGDVDAQLQFMNEYFERGGTLPGLRESLERMHPLSGMNQAERGQFIVSMNESDRERLVKALHFYGDMITQSVKKR